MSDDPSPFPEMPLETQKMLAGLALAGIYDALAKHGEFWAGWLELRAGPLGELGMALPDEVAAAKSLKKALHEAGELLGIAGVPKKEKAESE